MTADVEILILGGGPTGIGAARRLLEWGRTDFLLLEKKADFGGLAGSETVEGFTWDYGCHAQFSHYALFDRAMDDALDAADWIRHERNSTIWMSDRFVPYPFQQFIDRLDPEEHQACQEGLREAAKVRNDFGKPPEHFADWTVRTFGKGIARLFLLPYNEKSWAWPLETIDWRWTADRVSPPRFEAVKARATDPAPDQETGSNWGSNRVFRYPRAGGTGTIWRSLALKLPGANVRSNAEADRIDVKDRRLLLKGGESIRYRRLISAAPLDRLVRMTGDEDLITRTETLRHVSTHLVGLGWDGPVPERLSGFHWIYFSAPDPVFYRASVMTNFSPANGPQDRPCWSVLLEVSERPGRPLDSASVQRDCLEGFLDLGWIDQSVRPSTTWHRRLKWGYPVPTLGRDDILKRLLPTLEKHDIYSRGRFGAWKYEVGNQDHSYMQGVEIVDRLQGRFDTETGPEPTLTRPDLVYSGWFRSRE